MILLRRTCRRRYIVSQTWTLDVGLGHQLTPISFQCRGPDWLPLVIAHFWSLDHEHGTIYKRQYAQHRLCCHLNDS